MKIATTYKEMEVTARTSTAIIADFIRDDIGKEIQFIGEFGRVIDRHIIDYKWMFRDDTYTYDVDKMIEYHAEKIAETVKMLTAMFEAGKEYNIRGGGRIRVTRRTAYYVTFEGDYAGRQRIGHWGSGEVIYPGGRFCFAWEGIKA